MATAATITDAVPPSQVVWHPNPKVFNSYTIFKQPRDFPNPFVVRRFEFTNPTADVYEADTLENARLLLPPGLALIPHFPDDDPNIVEVWI